MKETWRASDASQPLITYYPAPISRITPVWALGLSLGLSGKDEQLLGNLLMEIYATVRGGQYRLAAMGIRALLEQMMISKVGDKGAFIKNLDAFHEKGYISTLQHGALSSILDVGHAAIHRSFEPSEHDLNTMLDIVEGVYAAIFVHAGSATALADRAPHRKPPASDHTRQPPADRPEKDH